MKLIVTHFVTERTAEIIWTRVYTRETFTTQALASIKMLTILGVRAD